MTSNEDEAGATSATAQWRTQPTATVSLPPNAEAAKIARDFVDHHRDHLSPALIADAQLLVSEIVTNAVLHGRPDITLAMRLDPPGLGVVVTDTGEDVPRLPAEAPDADQPSGRGLLIVDALASAWGVSAVSPPPGKAVWFNLRPPQSPHPRSTSRDQRPGHASQVRNKQAEQRASRATSARYGAADVRAAG